MYDPQNGDAADALYRQQILRAFDGSATPTGCGVTLGDSSSAIAVDVDSGDAVVDEDKVSVRATTKTLDSGDPDDPRFDTLSIDDTGGVVVTKGTPTDAANGDAPAPQTGGGDLYPARQVWNPAAPIPPGGQPAIAAVLVPAGATDTTDLQLSDVVDRRVTGRVAAVKAVEAHPDALGIDISGSAASLAGSDQDWTFGDLDDRHAPAATTPRTHPPDKVNVASPNDDNTSHELTVTREGTNLDGRGTRALLDVAVLGQRNRSDAYNTRSIIRAQVFFTTNLDGTAVTQSTTVRESTAVSNVSGAASLAEYSMTFDTKVTRNLVDATVYYRAGTVV